MPARATLFILDRGMPGFRIVRTPQAMYHGPSEGELSLFAWTWNVTDLVEAWPLGLLVAGGAFMFAGFAALARSIYLDNGETTASSSFSTLI